jgi:hypothetical protein
MNSRDEKNSDPCQLQVLPQGARPLTFSDRLRLLALRLLMAVERRLGRSRSSLLTVLGASEMKSKTVLAGDTSSEHGLVEGNWVEVRSLDEIRSTLDANNRCKGLEFMQGMEQYCGRHLRVRKKVRAIFDERAWRMLSIRNTFLLEDCICDGRGMHDKEGCDRCCFYFWKDSWLKKLPD